MYEPDLEEKFKFLYYTLAEQDALESNNTLQSIITKSKDTIVIITKVGEPLDVYLINKPKWWTYRQIIDCRYIKYTFPSNYLFSLFKY